MHIGKRRIYIVQYDSLSLDENYILFKNVYDYDTMTLIRDHMWIPFTKRWKKMKMQSGAIIIFSAKKNQYRKKRVVKMDTLQPSYVYDMYDNDADSWRDTLTNINNIKTIFEYVEISTDVDVDEEYDLK